MMDDMPQKLSTLFERKDYIYGAGIFATIYAFHGVQSQIFCDVLLGAFPALFTYKVILSHNSTHDGLTSLLFFWLMHGVFSSVVHLITPTASFFFLKYATLGIFFLSALNNNDQSLKSFSLNLPEVVEQVKHPAKSIFVETTDCTQMYTRQDLDRTLKKIVEEATITASTAFDFTDTKQEASSHRTGTPYAQTPGYGLWADSEGITTERPADFEANESDEGTEDNKTIIEKDAVIAKLSNLQKEAPTSMPGLSALTHQLMDSLHSRKVASGDDTEQPDRTCTVPLGHGDIDTRPATMINFDGRSVGKRSNIVVSNTSQMQIIWALKTNALDRLQASPTCGIIPSEKSIEIKFVISETCDGVVSGIDKVAIDYAFVPITVKNFDKALFEKTDRRRHLMRVSFDA